MQCVCGFGEWRALIWTQLTNDLAAVRSPDWNADGNKIMFKSDRLGNDYMWVMDVNSVPVEQVRESGYLDIYASIRICNRIINRDRLRRNLT